MAEEPARLDADPGRLDLTASPGIGFAVRRAQLGDLAAALEALADRAPDSPGRPSMPWAAIHDGGATRFRGPVTGPSQGGMHGWVETDHVTIRWGDLAPLHAVVQGLIS